MPSSGPQQDPVPAEEQPSPWPALRLPGDEEDDKEQHICRGMD
jgi:hypothetical protein